MERLAEFSERAGEAIARRRFLGRAATWGAGLAGALLLPSLSRAGTSDAESNRVSSVHQTGLRACTIYCTKVESCGACAASKSWHRCVNTCDGFVSYACLSPCNSFCQSIGTC